MQPGFIAIELSPIDAEYFVLFQKHYLSFVKMISAGVFDLKPGQAILNFGTGGLLDEILVTKHYRT